MNNRERFNAVLNYQKYDSLPIIHFGYWHELLQKWAAEGHITEEQANNHGDGNEVDRELDGLLGFDFCFHCTFGGDNFLRPGFEWEVVAELPDGSRHVRNGDGVVELEVPGACSIRAEIEHLLVDRASWEKHYLPRLQWTAERAGNLAAPLIAEANALSRCPVSLSVGSGLGTIRNWLGVVGLSYMQVDDPELLKEIIDTVADISFRNAEMILKAGLRPDIAHYWEDICFNHGPLVSPEFFRENVMPHYQRMSHLLRSYGCNLLSVDCDGLIDELLPVWLDGGVNVMFPMEIGTWEPDVAAWRERFGKEFRGVGAMNKHVLSRDRGAVDAEIERLRPLVALGGYIPCPDHRLPPEAKWELVQYYTDKMHRTFS